MNVERRLNLGCTIHHVHVPVPDDVDYEVDDYNNPVPVITTTTPLCYLEQEAADENTASRDLPSSTWLFVVAAGTPLDSNDRVTVDGYGTFEVFGDPAPRWNPRTRQVGHVEARVKKAVG